LKAEGTEVDLKDAFRLGGLPSREDGESWF
jgi:hypothetical protein